MSESRTHSDTDVSGVEHALRNAVDLIASGIQETNGRPNGELSGRLHRLADSLLAAAEDGAGSGELSVRRSDIDALRATMLQCIKDDGAGVDPDELVRLLSVMEDAVSAQWQRPRNEFTERLVGAQALDAVVEMAHDMRSPLSSILFLVDSLRRSQTGMMSPVQERQLGLIYGAAFGLNNLASDVVDAVRGDRLVDGRPIPFSISELISGICAIVRPIAEEKGLALEMNLPTNDGRLGYPAAVGRVLLNLITNALKYTEKGKVAIGTTELGKDVVEFWIEDTGRGIPAEVLKMLFDGFRPWAAGVRFSSAGLGLAICRNLLTAMDSNLEVKTEIEVGTRFSFVLTLERA